MVLLSLAALLFVTTFVGGVSGQSASKQNMSGVVETNLNPQGELSSASKSTTASLNSFQYTVEGDMLKISGLLEYNGEQFTINREGQIMHSKSIESDLIVDFGETLANAKHQIIVAQAAFRKNVNQDNVFNKENEGKNVLQLVLFNSNSNDLIKLEKIVDNIPEYTSEELDTVIHDFYDTKIFKPMSVKHEIIKNENTIMGDQIEDRSYCNVYSTHSQCVDYYVRLDYPNTITNAGTFDGILSIERKYTKHSNGYISDGSDILLGKDNNLIKTKFYLTKGLSSDKSDYIIQSRWGLKRDGIVISDSESLENPNNQINSKAAEYTLQLMNALGDWIDSQVQLVTGGEFEPLQPKTGYISDADIELPSRYHLWKKDDYLETDFRVNSMGVGNGRNRIARIDWTVPFFAPSDPASRPSHTHNITIQASYAVQ